MAAGEQQQGAARQRGAVARWCGRLRCGVGCLACVCTVRVRVRDRRVGIWRRRHGAAGGAVTPTRASTVFCVRDNASRRGGSALMGTGSSWRGLVVRSARRVTVDGARALRVLAG